MHRSIDRSIDFGGFPVVTRHQPHNQPLSEQDRLDISDRVGSEKALTNRREDDPRATTATTTTAAAATVATESVVALWQGWGQTQRQPPRGRQQDRHGLDDVNSVIVRF